MTQKIPNITFSTLEALLHPSNSFVFSKQIQEYSEANKKYIYDVGILIDVRDISEYEVVPKDIGEHILKEDLKKYLRMQPNL